MRVDDADGVNLHRAHAQGTRRQAYPAETAGSSWHGSQPVRVEGTLLKRVGTTPAPCMPDVAGDSRCQIKAHVPPRQGPCTCRLSTAAPNGGRTFICSSRTT
eukprot:715139-Rhodomonas_salina.1